MPQSEPGWDYGYARSPYFEFDHEREAVYTLYNRRLMPLAQRRGGNRLDDYWVLRTGVGHWHTGELLTEIKGPDAEKLCNLVFTKDIAKLRTGRCTYAPGLLSARMTDCRRYPDAPRKRPLLVRAGGR